MHYSLHAVLSTFSDKRKRTMDLTDTALNDIFALAQQVSRSDETVGLIYREK